MKDNQFNGPFIYDRETLRDFNIDPDARVKSLESQKALDISPSRIRAVIILKRDLVSSP